MIKRLGAVVMVLVGVFILVRFISSATDPSPAFRQGEKVRVTRSSEHAFSFRDGQKPWMPAEGWWRLTVVKDESDGWVKVQTHSPALIRYARASTLSAGWITSDQYEEKYHQAQLNAIAAKEEALAAKVHIPSSAQLKAEALAAKEHVIPSSHMESLISKVNRTFAFFSQPELLEDCHRKDNHNFECAIAPRWGGGHAAIEGRLSVTLYVNKTSFSNQQLDNMAFPLLTAFMPTAPQDLVAKKVARFQTAWESGTKKQIGLYPFYGSLSYKNHPNSTRFIIVGSPIRPFINGAYASSYRSATQ
ncbi:hypothetical protein [Acidithiobacillus sp.]|uniref:hypothetical protein n=1 Tax=Acidithiobacillus sp. TaxID=1872118 RepID=UPI002612CAB4|nr:hypothetical protein [Acidithiobacillus sp.]MDD2751225.1 hypothetical protein [Acidithiobacillus sp.]MDD5280511.1 hypothetical protein [Acidithiobacillus sp.]